jgi:predicted DNA-binding transcriptional regulator AlpA
MNSELSPRTTTQFLTTPDVCRMFDICRTTLYNWRKAGLLPSHKIKRNVYFLEHEITEAVQKIDFSDLSTFPYRNANTNIKSNQSDGGQS